MCSALRSEAMCEYAWLTLGQTVPPGASRDILWWLGVLVLAAVVMALAGLLLRKVLLRPDETVEDQGFTLADMRRLHEQGELSDEEFKAARALMIARSRAMMNAQDERGRTDGGDLPPPSQGGTQENMGDESDNRGTGES